MKMRLDSLKKKTILFVFIITAFCTASSSFMASKVVEKQMMDKYGADKEAATGVLSYSLAPMLDLYDYKQVEQLITSSLSYEKIASVAVFDGSGTLIRSAAKRNVSAEDLDMERCDITTSMRGIIGSIEIGFSKEYINKQIRTMTLALIFGLMGFFVLAGLGLYVFMNRSIIEPLETFTKTVKEMNSENLSARVKIEREDEIGALAASFNQMAENLEDSYKALSKSEKRFRTIFNAVNDAIFVHNLETGAILDINSRMCEMYGYSREEARGLDVEALSQGEPPYTQQDALTWIKKAAEGEPQILEWRARRKSGNLFWAELNMRHARIGDRNRLLVVVRDITERKLAEEALQKAHKELEARVEERTKNLKEKTEKLERMNKLFVDRELRMKELKEDIKKLKRKMREGKTLSAEMDDIGNENC
jgi:PAS domain S-box-containing protein